MEHIKNYESFLNLNENKKNNKSFDFKLNSDSNEVKSCTVNYDYRPSKKDVLADLKKELSKYKSDSIYPKFEPKSLIIYNYQYGWDNGYNAYLSTDIDADGYFDKPFFDEPTGKNAKKRTEYKFE